MRVIGNARHRAGRPATRPMLVTAEKANVTPTTLVRAVVVAVALTLLATTLAAPPAVAAAPTVVSLTFDDALADQLPAANALVAAGVRGTFYVPSGAIGEVGYLTVEQLRALAAAGHEIGGHTVSHQALPGVPREEALRQICVDRETLTAWGLSVGSFAYPEGAVDAASQALVSACGYRSARGVGNLRAPQGCDGCPLVEGTPPKDRYLIRTPGQVDGSVTFDQLRQIVERTESAGGGWLPLVFHHVCDSGCGNLSVQSGVLTAFVRWLASRASRGTVVKTVREVVGGSIFPVPPVPAASPHGVRNPSVETVDEAGFPSCWNPGGFGSNKPTFGRTGDARSGRYAEWLTVRDHVDGDAKLLQKFDLGNCSPPVSAGRSYTIESWYKASTRTQFSVYLRTSSGRWIYWWSSAYQRPTDRWTLASERTPPIPTGASGISFGLALFSTGSLVTDDYAIRPVPVRGGARRSDEAVDDTHIFAGGRL